MTAEKKNADIGERLSEALAKREAAIQTREDLIAFIDLLIEAHEAKELDVSYLPDYFETMAMRVGGLRQLCLNFGFPYPSRPGWFWIGRQLYAAFL